MKKMLLTFTLLMFTNVSVALAQEVEIPVFDDPTPNLPNIGRNAQPLDSLVLTPKPLPEVEVPLNPDKKQEPTVKKPEPQPVKPEPVPSIKREEPISITKDMGVVKIEKKDETPKMELPVQQKPTLLPPAPTPPVIQTPEALEGLFAPLHDVRGFEFAGLTLGMTPDEVMEAMRDMGYKRTKIQFGIPMFRTSFYEQRCRDKKVLKPADIRACIEKQADYDDVKYVSSMTFAKKATKEYIRVLFSSGATDNVAYKIYYESEGDNSLTLTRKNLAKQLRRKEMFWNMMFDTYGLPDDPELLVWGDTQKAYMQAIMVGASYNAYVVLEDKEVQDNDYFAAEDESKELTYKPQFTFGNLDEEE